MKSFEMNYLLDSTVPLYLDVRSKISYIAKYSKLLWHRRNRDKNGFKRRAIPRVFSRRESRSHVFLALFLSSSSLRKNHKSLYFRAAQIFICIVRSLANQCRLSRREKKKEPRESESATRGYQNFRASTSTDPQVITVAAGRHETRTPRQLNYTWPVPRRESRRRKRSSRRAAPPDTCSAPFAKLEIYSSARDGNRSWGAKVTRHNGDASISYPLLARTHPPQVPLHSSFLTSRPFPTPRTCPTFFLIFSHLCENSSPKKNSLVAIGVSRSMKFLFFFFFFSISTGNPRSIRNDFSSNRIVRLMPKVVEY